jgi:hypothetical protein
MPHGFLRRVGAAVSIALVVISLTAGAVSAGELTGNGKKTDQNQGRSWCSFSGQNDRIEGQGPTESRAQSFGQEIKAGVANPHELNPGIACNPNRTFLPPNPNRTH